MKQFFLAALLTLLSVGCFSKDLTEIKKINKIYYGVWNVTQISIDQGKTYFEPAGFMSFDISPDTIIMGNGSKLYVNKVMEAREKGIYFNVIVFNNSSELIAITRKANECMIALFSADRTEMVRMIVKSSYL